MSVRLTKLYNSAQKILIHLKSFDKEVHKNSVILKVFIETYMKMTKALIAILKERQKLDEIYKK